MLKRITDIVVALLALIILAKIMLLIALAILFTTGIPVIFSQTRVGRSGKEFLLLKFRTMSFDSVGNRPLVTAGNDPRITALGRVLRKWKLDELPQFWNVLTGDMSLVGPRPEVPQYAELWPADLRTEILSVRPGLIDLAYLELPNEEQALAQTDDPESFYRNELIPKKVAIYIRYVRTRSWIGDLMIILRSVKRIFSSRSY